MLQPTRHEKLVAACVLFSLAAVGEVSAQTWEDYDVGTRARDCTEVATSAHRLLRFAGPEEIWALEEGEWTRELRRPLRDGEELSPAWIGGKAGLEGTRAAWHAIRGDADGTRTFGTLEVWDYQLGEWTMVQRAAPAAPLDREGWGDPVSLDGDRVLLGRQIFDLVDGNWEESGRLPFDSTGLDPTYWGFSGGALQGDRAVLSVKDSEAGRFGNVQIFELVAGEWSATARLDDPSGEQYSRFGSAIALQDDRLFVGSPGLIGAARVPGLVHLYRHEGSEWLLETSIAVAPPTPGDGFGYSLAVKDDVLLVGAAAGEGQVPSSGVSFLFVRESEDWIERARLVGTSGARHGWHGASVALGSRFVAAQDWDLNDPAGTGHTDVWDRDQPPRVDAALVRKSEGGLVVRFPDGGVNAESYLIHEGALGEFDSHAPTDCGQRGLLLGAAGRELPWEPQAGSRYLLLGASFEGQAGPLGQSSTGLARTQPSLNGCED